MWLLTTHTVHLRGWRAESLFWRRLTGTKHEEFTTHITNYLQNQAFIKHDSPLLEQTLNELRSLCLHYDWSRKSARKHDFCFTWSSRTSVSPQQKPIHLAGYIKGSKLYTHSVRISFWRKSPKTRMEFPNTLTIQATSYFNARNKKFLKTPFQLHKLCRVEEM